MTNDVLKQGLAISNYFQEQTAARGAEVKRPAILDAELPNDPVLLAKHQSAVEAAEETYCASLLRKRNLTAAEQQFMGAAIAQYARRAARENK